MIPLFAARKAGFSVVLLPSKNNSKSSDRLVVSATDYRFQWRGRRRKFARKDEALRKGNTILWQKFTETGETYRGRLVTGDPCDTNDPRHHDLN